MLYGDRALSAVTRAANGERPLAAYWAIDASFVLSVLCSLIWINLPPAN